MPCTPFYVDLDSDGYGAGQATGFCGSTAPIGYAAQNGDCCDTATNIAVAKLIHPGADFQTISAGGVCNITWDYDCSGAVERSSRVSSSCTAHPECACVFTERPDNECGTEIGSMAYTPTSTNGDPNICGAIGEPAGTLACR